MFKKIFIAIVALFVIYFILCFMGPKKWEASVTKTITGTPEQVFAQVGDFKNWKNWSSWMIEDTVMKLTFGETTSGVGGSYSWTSEKSGAGSMKFTEVVNNQRVKADLKFVDFDIVSDNILELKPNGTNTDVTWSMVGQKETPFMQRGISFIMGFFYDVSNDFNKGLNNLDNYLKSGKAGIMLNGYSIKESQFEAKNYLSIRTTTNTNKVGSFFETHLPKIAEIAGAKIAGPPSGLYYKWDEKAHSTDMAAAFPISISTLENSTYKVVSIPASKEFIVDYYGAFEKTQMAYQALDSVVKMKNMTKTLIVEEYITDPMVEKDTAKWLTKIHFLVN